MRWVARSLSGQLLVLWLLAMLIAYGIAMLVVSWWRVDHPIIDPVSIRTLESRTAAAYRLVAGEHENAQALLDRIRQPDSVFRIAEGHTGPSAMDDIDRDVARAQRELLGLPPDWPVQVRLQQVWDVGIDENDADWLIQALGGQQAWTMDIEVELPDGRILVGHHKPQIMPAQWNRILTVSLLIGMLPTILIAFFLGRRIVRPLRTLTEAARKVSRGETVRLSESGPDGVREITQAFNDMQDSLTRLVKGRTIALAAIGHDLRTPLTSLRIRAELVDDAALRQAMIHTLDEMQVMLEETLTFARDDALEEPTQDVPLNGLVSEVVTSHRVLGRQVAFQSQLDDQWLYRCRPVHLKRALHNLIDNAARHGTVDVRVDTVRGCPRIAVRDRGPGISPEQLQHVFEPFVRLDPSRSRDTGGVGLGLTIARSCVHAHGGEITLRNRSGGGLCAVIDLPG